VEVAGAPLAPAKIYRLATNDFMARGGDGFEMFAGARRLVDANAAELMAAQAIRAFEAGAVSPSLDGRMAQAK